jgi:hypothetical protein
MRLAMECPPPLVARQLAAKDAPSALFHRRYSSVVKRAAPFWMRTGRWTQRPPRTGVIQEVVRGEPSPRYRISWDDGHESIYTPAAGALHSAEPAKRA